MHDVTNSYRDDASVSTAVNEEPSVVSNGDCLTLEESVGTFDTYIAPEGRRCCSNLVKEFGPLALGGDRGEMTVVVAKPRDKNLFAVNRPSGEVIHRRCSCSQFLWKFGRPVKVESHPHHDRINTPLDHMRLGQDAREFSVGERPIGHNEIIGPFQSRANPSDLVHCIDSGKATGER